jgi:ABC-type phosphate transport system substrate-binding protein
VAGTGRGRRGFRLRTSALRMTIRPVLRPVLGPLLGMLALAAAVAACGAPYPGQAGLSAVSARDATIKEAGSSLLYPLMHTWAGAYQQQTPGVTVATASTSSGKGIAAASAGKVDVGW